MNHRQCQVTLEQIDQYAAYLLERERSSATIQQYKHNLTEICRNLNGQPLTKTKVIEWKNFLCRQLAPATVNCILTVFNGFLQFIGRPEYKVRLLRIQRNLFFDEDRELTQKEYVRLIRAAEKEEKERLSLVIQTICSTGIRVSELKYITAEA